MANFARDGYGQVEANHLSAQVTGQIYAQLPLAANVAILQNGEFMKYDYANKEVNTTGIGPWMLVYNEIKLYDERKQMMKDFAWENAQDRTSYTSPQTADDVIYQPYMLDGDCPRLFQMNLGDIYTTNMVTTGVEYAVGNVLIPDTVAASHTGVLRKKVVATDTNTTLELTVVRVYTMPDGQPGLKLMVTKAI